MRSPTPRAPRAPDLRVGCDVAVPADIARSVAEFGDRYLDRVFTPTERRESGDDPVRLAGRFAAKEAVVKVLRPHPDEPIDLREIGIVHDGHGAPVVALSGQAAALARRTGLGPIAVSLSHERDLAFGTAVSRTSNTFRLTRMLGTILGWTRTLHRP